MRTKNKTIALLEIAIVLCSVFLVATLPGIAAGQTTQKVSTTTSEDDYVLGIYGNANEDDTIDMRDITFTARIILWMEEPTDFADANYDGKITARDMTQIGLIIQGQESELTLVDAADRIVTINQPTERVVTLFPAATEMVYAFGLNNLVGVDDQSRENERFDDLTAVGDGYDLDYSTIADLNPDLVITVMHEGCVPPSEIVSNLYDLGCYASVICIATDSEEDIERTFNLLGWIFHETECIDDLIAGWYGLVGVEWVTEYTWPLCCLPNCDDNAIGFYNRLGDAGWIQRFNKGDDDADEEHFEYDGLDYMYIDGVDIAFYSGHGTNTKLTLSTVWKKVYFQDEIMWGDSDLEWIALHSCNSTEIPENFKGSPYGLSGVHLICGFVTESFDVPDDGENFAQNLLDGETVKEAWFDAVDESHGAGTTLRVIGENEDCEDDHIWGQGSVIDDPPVDADPYEWTHECNGD